MASSLKYFGLYLWLLTFYIIGILLFTKGFLLKRTVVVQNSTCHPDFVGHVGVQNGQGDYGCWMHTKYKKAVILIIDALRFDFAIYNESIAQGEELPFQNKLPIIHHLLKTKPLNSKLYKFVADPPTTTLQRLKGLTTGSLPTFVDAGANFASTSIAEDNVIHQLRDNGKKITFMGDDTWENLFPNRFNKQYSFPSFNVKDLHTVDNGVIKHLVPELNRGDWDVLIAHFLGVDHCGHRYGPYHAAMTEKLVQMDSVLRSVVDSLKEDTILFVMGDHGMTNTGDHGGDSMDELEAALFIHSPARLTAKSSEKEHHQEISQIDLVPTISLLLGMPIPYSNLGSIIEGLFTYCPWWTSQDNKVQQDFHVVKALHLNSHQVNDYIHAYSEISGDFSHIDIAHLEHLFRECERRLQDLVTTIQLKGENAVDISEELSKLKVGFQDYLSSTKRMCQDIWAKFDLKNILLGITILGMAICLNIFLFYEYNLEKNNDEFCSQKYLVAFIVSVIFLLLCYFIYLIPIKLPMLIITLVLTIFSIMLSAHIYMRSCMKACPSQTKEVSNEKVDLFSIAHILLFGNITLYGLSLFSNSFIVHEDKVTSFLLQSFVWYYVYMINSKIGQMYLQKYRGPNKKIKKMTKFDIGRVFTSPLSVSFLLAVLLCLCLRLSENFRACREEQLSCVLSKFQQSISVLADGISEYKQVHYFISVTCVLVIPLSIRYWMTYYGNLNGISPSVICIRYVFPVGVASICLYWALISMPRKVFDQLPTWQIVVLPQVTYMSMLTILLAVWINPLCIYLVPKKPLNIPFIGTASQNVIPNVYNHIKVNWKKNVLSHQTGKDVLQSRSSGFEECQPPVVYGLATVFTSSQIVLVSIAVLLLTLLLGDGLSPSITLHLCIMFLLLEIHACHQYLSQSEGFSIPWLIIVVWGMLASEHFFSTGHQATITSIQWKSAYIGFHGDWNNYLLPMIFVCSNTFASHILCIVALPLVLYWPCVRGHIIFYFAKKKDGEEGSPDVINMRGDFKLHENPDVFKKTLFRLFVGYTLFYGIKICAIMCCAALHRRHLMVWKIFAPRFVYEGATFFVISVVGALVYLFVIRVQSVLGKWVKRLPQ